ncbi:hypothetical protein OGAPHI_007254 [Ogataea philodendri]|uniref:Uncharacterized protein n=1 Tax=Ogataea philodendri TaxID=1378263 RepID=A0A9P8SZF9_9ASCO|nr:uncharacterized protein OGAPHI_007254 [Ogataea philodendri]KAH3660049.1 hypothetical protein OGAPHI_007254 [Ogataea philodendri]
MHFVEEVVRQKAPVRAMNAPATASRAPTKRKRINYNIAALQNAIEQQNTEQDNDEDNDESERHVALELKKANRRFEELDRENFSEIHKFEIPKNLGPSTNKRASTPSVAVKRILNSKKNWSNYTDELDKAEMRALNGLEIKPGQAVDIRGSQSELTLTRSELDVFFTVNLDQLLGHVLGAVWRRVVDDDNLPRQTGLLQMLSQKVSDDWQVSALVVRW